MRVFRPSHEELAGLQADVSRRLVVIEGAVSLGIVRLALIRQGFQRFPADGFFAFQEDVDVDIIAVNLQDLLRSRDAGRIYIINIKAVAVDFDTAAFRMQQIVCLHVIEELLEQRMKRFDTIAMV